MPFITFNIQRYNPDSGRMPGKQEFKLNVAPGQTILDCLNYIKETLDASLAFRSSCRMGICGSCAMMINGFPRLACQTQVLSLGKDVITIEPLPNYPLIKDLVVDLTPLFDRHRRVKPYLITSPGKGTDAPREYLQTAQEQEQYLQFAYCLKCGICLAACPTVATDDEFLGPQALTQAYRYNTDTRDAGRGERIKIVDSSHGVWRCHMAGACAEACPKGVDPALALQLLKRDILRGRTHPQAAIAPPVTEVRKRSNIPRPPARTVKASGQAGKK
ncbi:Fumarate reductase iron-sulfur subunit [Moorella thermoacetica]|uniref:succinate dehydrogenase/fumarate reductase iron-sulfur subunit n=1 Tax=Neomoorella thermoacetica TaxID=1525 RepID=UPI0030CF4E5E